MESRRLRFIEHRVAENTSEGHEDFTGEFLEQTRKLRSYVLG